MVKTLLFRIVIAFIIECTDRKKTRKQKDYLDKEKVFEKAKSIYAERTTNKPRVKTMLVLLSVIFLRAWKC